MRKKLRHELKYYIRKLEAQALRSRIQNILTLDKHSISAEGYHIRSLYFDNVYETALYDKTSGVFRRKKYRIRIYNKSDKVIRLERKSKFDSYVMKESIGMTKEQFYMLLQGDSSFLRDRREPLLVDFYQDMMSEYLRPAVVVDYVREAYIYPVSDVRVTFDKHLSASVQSFDIFDKQLITREMVKSSQTILEVKYNHFLPAMIYDILQISTHNRSAISKYVICKESRKAYSV